MAHNKKKKVVVGVFRTRREADRAMDELLQSGFTEDQVGLVTREGKEQKVVRGKMKQETYAEEGAMTGAVAGAGVGGLVGLGVLSGVVPVIGPVLAVGALGTVLLNALGGAAIASLAGALIGLGIPEEEAEYYEGELKEGHCLVLVTPGRRASTARAILRRHGGYDQHSMTCTEETTHVEESACAAGTEDRAVEVREEELEVRKTPVHKGNVRIRKDVVTEARSVQVPVTREEVVVERRAASGRTSSRPVQEEEIRIPVREEQIHVEKKPVVKEEVRIGKRRVSDTEEVGGTVRKERVHVETEGDVNTGSRRRGSTIRER